MAYSILVNICHNSPVCGVIREGAAALASSNIGYLSGGERVGGAVSPIFAPCSQHSVNSSQGSRGHLHIGGVRLESESAMTDCLAERGALVQCSARMVTKGMQRSPRKPELIQEYSTGPPSPTRRIQTATQLCLCFLEEKSVVASFIMFGGMVLKVYAE